MRAALIDGKSIAAATLEQLTGILQGLNADPRVNGIIIRHPLPDHIPVKVLQKSAHPLKDVEGGHPASIGHSEIAGKPIAYLLMGLGATVTLCHHMTRPVAMHSRAANAVFVAVGR